MLNWSPFYDELAYGQSITKKYGLFNRALINLYCPR